MLLLVRRTRFVSIQNRMRSNWFVCLRLRKATGVWKRGIEYHSERMLPDHSACALPQPIALLARIDTKLRPEWSWEHAHLGIRKFLLGLDCRGDRLPKPSR